MLESIRVAQVGGRAAAEFAGRVFADLGAGVTAFYPPEHRSPPYLERGKEIVRAPSLEELGNNLTAAIDGFDLAVVGMTRTDRKRLNLDFEHRPDSRLRVALVTPFGESGPYADWQGTDLECQALGGASLSVGKNDRPPLPYPGNQSGTQAGLVAVTALLAALQRDVSSTEVIEVSESDVWATFHTGTGIVNWIFHNRKRQRAGHRVADGLYPHQLFRCADGWVAVDCAEGRQWRRFLEVVGHPEWSKEPNFKDRRALDADRTDALLSDWFQARTRDEVFAACRAAAIPAAPVLSLEEAVSLEQLAARQFLIADAGRVYPGLPFRESAPVAASPRPGVQV
ncbi:MAG: hypothetical protein GEU28_12620 [Dehalococcoidia bacterium]|nr:hypothetical protein [Dehalococcoidia bacterium]